MPEELKEHSFFHPARRLYRYTILFFVSLLTFGSYFAYDSIGALSNRLIKQMSAWPASNVNYYVAYSVIAIFIIFILGIICELYLSHKVTMLVASLVFALAMAGIVFGGKAFIIIIGRFVFGESSTVSSLYSAYSEAALISVFLGGVLIDRLGTRKASLLFSFLVVIGAIIVALANKYWVIFLGRFIFGAGSESLVVAQLSILSKWFKGKELALSFGISLTICRLGTLFSYNAEAGIADHYDKLGKAGNKYALWAAAILCLFSLVSNLVYWILDAYGDRKLRRQDAASSDKIVFSDVKLFRAPYWFVTLLCLTFYSAIFPFTALSTNFFTTKWGIPDVQPSGGSLLQQVFFNLMHMFRTAPGITSIVILAAMIFAPFAGRMVDRIGKRASLMILGCLILIPSHLILGITQIYPAYPMAFLGIAFILVPAALWPSITLSVPKEKVGTAFGLTTMIQNGGLILFPILNGLLRDHTHSYNASQIMFVSLGVLGLLFAILLLKADRKAGGILEKP